MTRAASVGDGDRLRLFLALQLPSEVLDTVADWQARHLERGRLVPREHLHVTLAFLGTRPGSELSAIVDALRSSVEGVGELPLAPALAERLHALLAALGVYEPEARPWLPHLTVLRFRERPRLRPALPGTGTFVPSGVAAYLSRLHPTGARYEVLDRISLNAGG